MMVNMALRASIRRNRNRTGTATALSLLLCSGALAAAAFLHVAASNADDPPPDKFPVTSSQDLDGDGSDDMVDASPSGESPNEFEAGLVVITTGTDRAVTITGREVGDLFGASIAVAGDLNGDGFADLIVGAPLEQSGEGRAYVFYGPFRDYENPTLHVDDADMIFRSPLAGELSFGTLVRRVADVDCDGRPDLGIAALAPAGQGTPPILVSYIVSGASGAPLYRAVGGTPFNTWFEAVGDAEGDGDVDSKDLAIVNRNLGSTGAHLTLHDGDFNADAQVNGIDRGMLIGNWGANHSLPIRKCGNTCPPSVPPGFHCVQDCDGDWIVLPSNVWPDCNPILCTMDSWCGYTISILGPGPMAPTPNPPHRVGWESEVLIEVGTGGTGGPADWVVLEGEDLIEVLEVGYDSFRFRALEFGNVRIRCSYSPCPGSCYLEVPIDIIWVDSDSDGIPDHWEFLLGLDPNDPDTDGDGVPDGDEDADGDGLSNHDEFIYSTNPLSPDSDGDGVNDGDEVAQGSDPNDGSDGGVAPNPEDLVSIVLQVGDSSSSNSEMWMLEVGDIRFKAPGHGEVTPPTIFQFLRGKSYPIKLVHLSSNVSPPDYDYTAHLTPEATSCAIVDDPQSLLGVHWSGESNPAAGKEATLHLPKVDLDVDTDNTNGFSAPDSNAAEDEAEMQGPGKLMFTGLADTDSDGIPDWADGIELAGLEAGPSGAAFVPLVLDVPDAVMAALDDPSAYVALAYDMSDPALITPGNLSVRPPGAFRLWTKDGTSMRNPLPATEGGDLVAPGVRLDRTKLNSMRSGGDKVTLYLEAVGPTTSEAQRTITASLVFSTAAGNCPSPVTDSVKAAAIEIEILDARAWGPSWSPEAGVSLSNSDLDADMAASAHIGGAITDGASLCVIRLKPYFSEITQVWPDLEIAMTKGGDATVNEAKVVGTFHPVSEETAALPPLPTPFDALQAGQAATAPITSGKAFYVPPETYADPTETLSAQALNALEECRMRIELRQGGTPVAARSFLLRRPPLVLVHGILSSPATWSAAEWNEVPGSPVPTRVYKADWSATSSKGYSENYGIVALAIEEALSEYRTANDNGHAAVRSFRGIRYAATRADVVAHSQGGQLARFYIADGMPAIIDRVGWISSLLNGRNEASASGRWPYLRSGNYGAGSIRRLVTLGSPFKGSPLANTASLILAPGEAGDPVPPPGYVALLAWYTSGRMDPGLASMLFQGTPANPGAYIEPTCVADLCAGSDAQLALEAAIYPSGHRQVRWYPIVGIATQSAGNAPVQGALWELLFSFLPMVPNDPTEISPLSPANSDLIVPAASQRNLRLTGSPNELAGQEFQFTAHVAVPGLSGETSSVEISTKVRSLLSGWPTVFNTSWSIGP